MYWHYLVAVVFALLGAAGATAQEPPTDLERLQGTWRVVGVENAGKKEPVEAVAQKMLTLTFTGRKYVEKAKGEVTEEGEIKLMPGERPRHLDIQIGSGEAKGKTQLGIYRLDGDRLTVAVSAPGDTRRPIDFRTQPDSKHVTQIFERVK